jgi:hypothetical protein
MRAWSCTPYEKKTGQFIMNVNVYCLRICPCPSGDGDGSLRERERDRAPAAERTTPTRSEHPAPGAEPPSALSLVRGRHTSRLYRYLGAETDRYRCRFEEARDRIPWDDAPLRERTSLSDAAER